MDCGDSTLPFNPDPESIVRFCSLHPGVVENVSDPEGRGRVKVSCPGLAGEGKKNWAEFCDVISTRVGNDGEGDVGLWWTPEPGQSVFVFFACGDPEAPCCIPGMPCLDGGKPLIPKEVKARHDESPRKATRLKCLKSEAGHALLMDDNGQEELLGVIDWAGGGIATVCPGKQKDDGEGTNERSKPRKGDKRGTKSIFKGDAPKPSAVMKDGVHRLSVLDLNSQGLYLHAEDGKGKVGITACKEAGKPGPHIYMDSEDDVVIIGTSKCQIQILGDRIFVTKQMVLECAYTDVTGFFKGLLSKFKKAFEVYK